MKMVNGPTGSGKSSLVNTMLLPVILAGMHWVVCYFIHPLPAMWLIAELYARLGETIIPRLIIDRLSEHRRVLMTEIVPMATGDNWLLRLMQQERDRGLLFETATHNRPDLGNSIERPNLFRFGSLAVLAKTAATEWWSDQWIPFAVSAWHPVFKNALRVCGNPDVRAELERLQILPLREQQAIGLPIENMFGPLLYNACVRARTSSTVAFSLEQAMRERCVVIIIADELPIHVQRLYFALTYERMAAAARRGVGSGIFAADEMNRIGITDGFAMGLATLRASNVEIIFCQQHLAFRDDAQQRAVLQNTDHYWLPQNDPITADLAMRDCRGLLDKYEVHHYDEHIQRFDDIQHIERESVSVTKGAKGKSETKTTTLVQVSTPRYEVLRKPVYMTASELAFWSAGKLQESPIGTVLVKPRLNAPYVMTVQDFPNSWGYQQVREARFWECYEKVLAKPIYQVPVELPFPAPAAQTTNMARGGRRRRSR